MGKIKELAMNGEGLPEDFMELQKQLVRTASQKGYIKAQVDIMTQMELIPDNFTWRDARHFLFDYIKDKKYDA